MNKTLFTTTLLATTIAMTTNVSARPEFVAATGAAGCTSCHYDNFGSGYKPGVITAAQTGGIAGLAAFIQSSSVSTDTAPVLSQINSQWDVTVGETPLVIPLQVSDKENDTFSLRGSVAMTGYSLSTVRIDSATNLPTIDLKWTPSAANANQNYAISIYAKENATTQALSSNTVTANVHVWPARANAATAKVREFKVQAATWTAATNTLKLSGQVIFKSTVGTLQRKIVAKTVPLNIRSNSGFVTGSPSKITPNAKTGVWTKTLKLTASQVPCLVKVEYEGLNSSRAVNAAPASTCVK